MSNKTNDGGAAFPGLQYGSEKGMSYHDVAALMAMQGMNADPSIGERVASVARSHNISGLDVIAKWAHKQADAMLAERERRNNNE